MCADRQKSLEGRKQEALEGLRREPELDPGRAIQFLAHALVLPSDDPEDQRQFDAEVEAIAMKVAMALRGSCGSRREGRVQAQPGQGGGAH